ncbi:MAG: imidazole glycerol phosphate synthase subunit HisH [Acidobacteria bacterium]|nr:imidazole glycerol phosphate synthase subunit HisH [Acidobacteriota bacterium]
MRVTVVPTGTANMASVAAAFNRLRTDVRLASTPDEIRQADQLVVPGVGAFAAAMGHIDEHRWRSSLVDRIEAGRPTLAICVGMQLLCERSEENIETYGLGVVSETVTRFPEGLNVPQLGWNRVTPDPESRFLRPGWAYFANSYRLGSVSDGWIGAKTEYGGSYVSAMEKGDVLACQFHPELSGEWGSNLLGRWLEGTRSGS